MADRTHRHPCGATSPHGEHEWYDPALRQECPGVPVPTEPPRDADRRHDQALADVFGGLPAVPEEKRPAAMWVCGAKPERPRCTSRNPHRGRSCHWVPVGELKENT